MEIFRTIEAYVEWRWEQKKKDIGFVPTMGALHDGHGELIKKARAENSHVVVSIFVNPTQFNDPEDCRNYPTPVERDLQLCEDLGVDAVLMPLKDDLYPDDYRYKVTESSVSLVLEGKQRPGHFDGVLTIVLKLFLIVQPTRAYFGEKDWQQLELVKGMAESFFLPIEVIPCPTIREADGLAMSSRNVRLSADDRKLAPNFYRILSTEKSLEAVRPQLTSLGFTVEYVEELGGRRLGAVQLNGVRLIDNLSLQEINQGKGAL